MLYKTTSKNAALDVLKSKMLSVANSIQFITSEGYIPNSKKFTNLGYNNIIIELYNNLKYLNNRQRDSLNRLYDKFTST